MEGADTFGVGSTALPNRRLFQRVPADGLEVEWNVRARKVGWTRRSITEAERGIVTDLSVAGAQILGPLDPDLRQGSVVTICANGSLGQVIVRWIASTNYTDTNSYGVKFADLHPDLKSWLMEPVHAGLAKPGEAKWTASPTVF